MVAGGAAELGAGGHGRDGRLGHAAAHRPGRASLIDEREDLVLEPGPGRVPAGVAARERRIEGVLELIEIELVDFADSGTQSFNVGEGSVAVPGLVAGLWEAHARFATVPWGDLVTPAILILPFPGLFRFTCYYYRKAYYRSFAMTPPACAVGAARPGKYNGERKLLLFQNLHRFALYFALLFLVFLWHDFIKSLSYEGRFHLGVGSLVIMANCTFLTLYTISCHSFRHLVGGSVNSYSEAPLGMLRYSEEHAKAVAERRAQSPTTASLEDGVRNRSWLCGPAADIVGYLKELEAKYPGLDHVMLGWPIGVPRAMMVEQLERFAAEVMPAFKR